MCVYESTRIILHSSRAKDFRFYKKKHIGPMVRILSEARGNLLLIL